MPLWGKIDDEANKPKYLSDTLINTQTLSDKGATAGIDRSEAATAANRLKSIKTPGWTQYRTYTDANGNVRHKAEVLVAFGGDFTTGDNDTFPPNPVVTITLQPLDLTIQEGQTGSFLSLGEATRGATVTYQWSKAESATPTTFVDIAGATLQDFAPVTPTVADDDGDVYRVTVLAVGATPVVSNAVTLTVTAP